MPAKGVVEDLQNDPCFILVTNKLARPQKVDKHKVLGRLNNDVYKIINTDSQTFEAESPPMSVISIVVCK